MSSPSIPLSGASSAQPVVTTEQKVLDTAAEVSAVAASIASRFGHNSIASACAMVPTLAPVFAGLFDTIKGLFAHHAATAK